VKTVDNSKGVLCARNMSFFIDLNYDDSLGNEKTG